MGGVVNPVASATASAIRPTVVVGTLIDGGPPSSYLLGRFPFIGELSSESSWIWSVTLPDSYFSLMGIGGPFFTDAGVPINVPQVLVEDWISTNGQQPHWWVYRHWLYVYDPCLITSSISNKLAKIVKSSQSFNAFLTFGDENVTFNGSPIEV